jgi:N-acylneuraminate cytidylyltransferase/CMP-N,N'-diacetyllegionaminic acid synthase
MKILALIPARGGSKGIPRKNIRLFNDKPLIAYSIEAAQASKNVERIVVSTEDEEIASVAKAYGAEVPCLRPVDLSGDKSAVIEAVLYTLDHLKMDDGYEPTHILFLQPTNPTRTSQDIDNAVELFKKRGADSLVSVCHTENSLFTKDEEDGLHLARDMDSFAKNRQELPKLYKLDGCMIYLIRVDLLRETRSFFAGKLVGYEIERWRAVDLDEVQDFVVGELIYQHKDEIAEKIRNFK